MNGPNRQGRLFQQMHLGPEILVIANAWDAASARVFEDAGMRAVGTYTRFHGDAVSHPEANRLFE